MSWHVYIDGKCIGIVETNYAYASKYWQERARLRGFRVKLIPYDTPTPTQP